MSSDSNIIKEGYLKKESLLLKIPRQRWMVLNGRYLYSYKRKRVYENPTEIFDLTIYNKIQYKDNDNGNKFELVSTTKKKNRQFNAPSKIEVVEWVKNIKNIQKQQTNFGVLKAYEKLLSMGFDDIVSFHAANKFNGNLDKASQHIINSKNEQKTNHFISLPQALSDARKHPQQIFANELMPIVGEKHQKDMMYAMEQVDNPKDIDQICYFLLTSNKLPTSECGMYLESCQPLKRVEALLNSYKLWLSSMSSSKQNANDISNMLCDDKYNICELLNDFNHLIHTHNNDYHFEIIQKMLCDKFACNTKKCDLLMRNNRDRSNMNHTRKREKLYYGYTDNRNVTFIQELDRIHCYFAHCYDIGMQLTLKEKLFILYSDKQNNEIKLYQKTVPIKDDKLLKTLSIIQSKAAKLNELRGSTRHEKSKFNTIVFMKSDDVKKNINDNENDKNMIGTMCNTKNKNEFPDHIVSQQAIENENKDDMKQNDMKQNVSVADYSYGFEYFYFEKHKYPELNEMEGSWFHGNGTDYKIKDFHISAKYANLKEELLTNQVCNIEKHQYDDVYQKASQHLVTEYALSIKCPFKETKKLEVYHLMVMMMYCNFTNLQFEISKTYRRIPNDEPIAKMKQRHSVFGNFGKWLKKILLFSTVTHNKATINNFYHGINVRMVFSKTTAAFKSPTSTSDKIEVCMAFAANDGMIINLRSGSYLHAQVNKFSIEQFEPRYFDCCWLSDFGNESEKFFIAQWNVQPLDFGTIIFTSNGEDFKFYIMAMNIINVVFGDLASRMGGWTAARKDYTMMDLFQKTDEVNLLELTLELIENEFSFYLPNQYKKSESCPMFIQQMVHKYFSSMDEMSNFWDILSIMQYQSTIAYRIIISRFFLATLPNNKWWRLDLLTLIMPNLTRIVFWESSNLINDEIMEYIISFVINLSSKSKLRAIVWLKFEDIENSWFNLSKMELYNKKFEESHNKSIITDQYTYAYGLASSEVAVFAIKIDVT
eukprot:71914_1